MASENEHLRQAAHNEEFLTAHGLADTPYTDWAVTAIFYAALHYVRALLSRYHYTNISRYGEMDKAFERVDVLRRNDSIYVDYRQLKDDSRAARYDMWKPTGDEVIDLRDGELSRIRSFVLATLFPAA